MGSLQLLTVAPENAHNLSMKGILKISYGLEVENLGKAGPTREATRNCHKVIRGTYCRERSRHGHQREVSHFRRSADFHFVPQCGKKIDDGWKLGEMHVHEAGSQNERANCVSIAFLLTCQDL